MQGSIHTETASGFCISRGVNLSHWLSQAIVSQRNLYFADDDLKTIKELGFDHVRIPIDEHEMWNDDGLIIGRSFLMLKKCLDLCLRHSLKAVIVIKCMRCTESRHQQDTNPLWGNILAQENLLKLWRNLSDFLKDYPRSMLAYEILNEPNAPSDAQWNRLLTDVFDTIRKRERERVIIIGSNCMQSESTVTSLALPDDRNTIISIRFFKPFGLTHYKAEWTQLKNYSGPVAYPGVSISKDVLLAGSNNDISLHALLEHEQVLRHWDREQMLLALQPAAEFCRKRHISLYCNQFGCLPTVPDEMRLSYYKDIISCFAELGIAYSFWDFKGRFGVLMRSVNNEFVPDPVITAVLE